MGDVADILGLKTTKDEEPNLADLAVGKKPGAKVPVKKKGPKPAGVSREVFALLGEDGLAPMVRILQLAALIFVEHSIATSIDCSTPLILRPMSHLFSLCAPPPPHPGSNARGCSRLQGPSPQGPARGVGVAVVPQLCALGRVGEPPLDQGDWVITPTQSTTWPWSRCASPTTSTTRG